MTAGGSRPGSKNSAGGFASYNVDDATAPVPAANSSGKPSFTAALGNFGSAISSGGLVGGSFEKTYMASR